MAFHILITYGSRYGSTAEIAQAIAEELADAEVNTTIQPVEEVADLDGYDAVIVGGPVYSSEWLPVVTEFVKDQRVALATLPTACFLSDVRLKDQSKDMREAEERLISMEKVLMQPVSVGLFGGALDYSKLSPIVKLQAQTKNLPEGDFRDWDMIRQWAYDILPLLQS